MVNIAIGIIVVSMVLAYYCVRLIDWILYDIIKLPYIWIINKYKQYKIKQIKKKVR